MKLPLKDINIARVALLFLSVLWLLEFYFEKKLFLSSLAYNGVSALLCNICP